jgi:acrylyl-CoA reductase (NADPH)
VTQDLPFEVLETVTQIVALEDVPAKSREILAGQIRGRVVVEVNG